MELEKQINYAEYLHVSDGKAVTTSKIIAEVFGKRHDHVLESIRELILCDEISRPNFREREYIDSRGKTQPMYLIDRDGFMLLGMGFTGKEALVFKIGLIKALNVMEAELMKRNTISTPNSMLEAMEFATNQLRISIEQQKVIDNQSKQLILSKRKTDFYDKVIDMNGWYSWSQVAKIINVKNTGRNTLLNKLCVLGILNIKNEPYQKYVDRGYFKCIQHLESKTNKITTITSLKGIEFICKKLEIIADLNNLPTFVNETKLKSLF